MSWLAITDDTAYFEPYTFGGNLGQENATIGSLLPVFKIQSDAVINVFGVFEDHFKKLWATSDVDMFYVGARLEDRERIVRLIFEARRVWFQNACGVLAPDSEGLKAIGVDRRIYPRRPCQTTSGFNVYWGKGKSSQVAKAEIINYSCESVLLKMEGYQLPTKGRIVTLKTHARPDTTSEKSERVDQELIAAEYLKENLLRPTNGLFRVTRLVAEESSAAMQAHNVKDRN